MRRNCFSATKTVLLLKGAVSIFVFMSWVSQSGASEVDYLGELTRALTRLSQLTSVSRVRSRVVLQRWLMYITPPELLSVGAGSKWTLQRVSPEDNSQRVSTS